MPMPENPSAANPHPEGAPGGAIGGGPSAAASGAARPVFLLADSRLLFAAPAASGAPSLPERLRAELPARSPAAAYLGASNGDEPAFYEIFEAAMERIGVNERRFVRASPSPADLDFLRRADLLLLAGGEVERGWRAFAAAGIDAIVAERYRAGAVLVGVSAGAVQLGHGWLPPESEEMVATAGLLPFLIDAHDEPEWAHLRRTLRYAPDFLAGLGIPFGAAAVVAPDMTVEPLEKPLLELFRREQGLQEALLLPESPAGPAAAPLEPTLQTPPAAAT